MAFYTELDSVSSPRSPRLAASFGCLTASVHPSGVHTNYLLETCPPACTCCESTR